MRVYILIPTIVLLLVYSTSADIINIPADYPTIQAGIDAGYESDTVPVGSGQHAFTWHASHLPSGIYFAQLETGDAVETIKMVLLK
jgi:hypothetical protein